jgi:ABC-2 type transport system permease protein
VIAAARIMLVQLWRERRLSAAFGVLLALAATSILLDRLRTAEVERDRIAAEQLDQQTFEAQGARNPHSVAHFSRFAFRPRLATAALDPGVSSYTGTAVWMEAHRQNVAGARPGEDHLDLGRATELGLAWIWQVVAPLLLICLGFDAIARERERRTLSVLAVSGLSLARLAAGKGLALFAVIGGTLLVTLVLSLAAGGGSPVGDRLARVTLWASGYLGYLAVWTMITLAVSVRARTSRIALVTLLGAWALATLVVPRVAATVADEQAPIPSAAELWAAMERDLEEGLDGHSPADQRSQELEARTLARYRVSSLSELPVSFAGIALEESERFGNLVFDKHHRSLAQRYAEQRGWRRLGGLVSPLVPLRHLSAAAAGTDVEHHLEFTQQAEQQRRVIISKLNADMIANGAGKDFEYLADPALWQRIPAFRYTPPPLRTSTSTLDWLALGGWLLGAGLLLAWMLRRAALEVLP